MFYQVHSQTTVLFPTFSSKQETKREQVQEENHFMEVRCQWRRLWLISLTLNFSSKTDHQPVEPFEDEIHPRLRFSHRGLVGMANNGTKNSNDSQFFITLGPWSCFATVWSNLKLAVSPRCFNLSTFFTDRADELHGKHTLFGRCVGDTVFSALLFTFTWN